MSRKFFLLGLSRFKIFFLYVVILIFTVSLTIYLTKTHEVKSSENNITLNGFDAVIQQNADDMLKEGRQIFRFDTFGSEDFWGGNLKLHLAILGSKQGGVGAGVSPNEALKLGLKVDMTALPEAIVEGIKEGSVDLNDPVTTTALLKVDAVIGVKGIFSKSGKLESIGIQ
ncbi:MAG: hypothetical protein ACRDFC_07415, partial [Ignavibacteria bacterium]